MNKNIIALLILAFSSNVLADGTMASDGNLYRVVANQADAKDADTKALEACKSAGGVSCKVIARFTRGCWAIGKDRQLGKSAPAVGYPSIEEARTAAMQNCSKAGGINCIVTDNQGCEKSSLANQNWPKDDASPKNSTSKDISSPVTVNNSPLCNQLRNQLNELIDSQHGFLAGLNDAAAMTAWQKKVRADEKFNNQQLIIQYSEQIRVQCGG